MATTITIPSLDGRARWLAVATAATALLLAATAPSFGPRPSLAADAAKPDHTISVSGTGRVILAPDVADLRIGVSVQRATVRAARADAAKVMTAVIAALKKVGLADADVQTSGITLQPQYDYSNGAAPRLIGYQFSNSLTVTVRKLDVLGVAPDEVTQVLLAGSFGAYLSPLSAVRIGLVPKLALPRIVSAGNVEINACRISPGNADGAVVVGASSVSREPGTNEVSVTVAVAYLIP